MKCLISAATTFALLFSLASHAAAQPATSFDAGSVHVDQYGKGEPALVLIPGLTDSAAAWQTTIAHFAPTHRIYALTLPGFGGRAPIAAPMLDTVVADVAAFLPKAGKPVVIGHSMGGFLAIRLAEEHSDLTRGAIAADGLPVFAGMDKMSASERAAAIAPMRARMAASTPDEFARGERAAVVYMTKPEHVEAVAALSRGADPSASATYMEELVNADVRPQLGKITVPLLELAPFDASLDPRNPSSPMQSASEKGRYYAQLLAADSTAKVAVIDDSRHFMMYDRPDEFFTAIQTFLSTLR